MSHSAKLSAPCETHSTDVQRSPDAKLGQGVATQAWEHRTGGNLDDFPDHKIELPKEPQGTAWSENGDDLPTRCPKLYRKFW